MKVETIWSGIQFCFAAIGGGLSLFLGGMDGFLYALIVFTILDYVTGIMCAVIEKKVSSEVGFKGIFKKVLIFVMVAVGYLVDTAMIGSSDVVRTAVIFFYLSNEGISILENASRIGLPVPQKLKDILAQLHDHNETEEK